MEAGIINVSKPTGVTSYWVVRQVKRILGLKKVGHAGTLDPLAEGVLVILFGAATKKQDAVMGLTKTYRTRLRLGVTTDTGDITGRERSRAETHRPDDGQLRDILAGFTGEISQIPPMYSALKQNGRRLYELARAGQEVVRQPRTVTIYSLDLLGCSDSVLELRVRCSRGTYIRTLGEDIGRALGFGATVEYLCREEVGPFAASQAVDGKTLTQLGREELLTRCLTIEQLSGYIS